MNRGVIFLASFLTMLLELALIRFVAANIPSVGYFTNLILLGCLFGICIGFFSAKFSRRLLPYSSFALFIYLLAIRMFPFDIAITSQDQIFFKGLQDQAASIPSTLLLPLIFVATAMLFIPISQTLGKAINRESPLAGYSFDISGALAAIVFFSAGSAWSVQPYVWFTLASIVLSVLLVIEKSFSWLTAVVLLLIPCIPFSAVLGQPENAKTVWSPYSKLSIISQDQTTLGKMIVINSNNLGHQFITDYRTREDFYFTPYAIHKPSAYKRILVIGAGSGMDVSTALHLNPTVERIDAVEIDPDIAELGKTMNFNKPYDDPRVHIYIDDGRSFLEHTKETYDLIIFALTDSVIITRSASNIRLESFLFTKEAFTLAKSHLSEKGVFTLYNYYRENWLIDRIALMMKQSFGTDPFVKTYGDVGKAAIFLTGPGAMTLLDSTIDQHTPDAKTMMATDDWPFLYVKDRTIPDTYRWVLLSIVGIVAISTVFMLRDKSLHAGMLRYFFMGVGFMLLETKQLVMFGLLFGNTWVVNALVFGAILGSVLVAIGISKYLRIPHGILAGILFGSLLLSYVFPSSRLIQFAPVIRYVLATLLYFSPIVAANILFSDAFKEQSDSSATLAVNMFGTIIGGVVEYTAMITGYAFLTWWIIACYMIVVFPLFLKRRG